MFAFLHAAWSERDPYLTRIDAEPYFPPISLRPKTRLVAFQNESN
jgi:hypothetical protein